MVNVASPLKVVGRLQGRAAILPTVIIATALALCANSLWDDSLTIDEVGHIGAGYAYLTRQEYRFNPEHPPLAKDLAAVPLLFAGLNQDAYRKDAWVNGFVGVAHHFGLDLIFRTGNDPDRISRLARLPMLLFFLSACGLVFVWTRRLYGYWPAVLGLFFLAFSPTFMAHTRFVTTDSAALWGTLTAAFFFLGYLLRPTWKSLAVAGVAFGLALLAKFSTVLLIPFFVLTTLLWSFVKPLARADRLRVATGTILIMLFGFVLVVWPVYLWHTWNYPPDLQKSNAAALLKDLRPLALSAALVHLSDMPVLRAISHYGLGLQLANVRQTTGGHFYFMGQVFAAGVPSYFPTLYFFKETLAWWLLVGLALGVAVGPGYRWLRQPLLFSRLRPWMADHFEECAMLLWLAIYWTVAVSSKLNIGVRHILPVFPFTIILVSGGVGKLMRRASAAARGGWSRVAALRAILILLAAWQVYEIASVHPFYLAYYNQLAGGPKEGYRIAVDSSYDWGQDLKRLGEFLRENKIAKVEGFLFGSVDAEYYLDDRVVAMPPGKYRSDREFMMSNSVDGWVVVSATHKMSSRLGRTGSFDWLDDYDPVATIGNSIFVYRIKPGNRRPRR